MLVRPGAVEKICEANGPPCRLLRFEKALILFFLFSFFSFFNSFSWGKQ